MSLFSRVERLFNEGRKVQRSRVQITGETARGNSIEAAHVPSNLFRPQVAVEIAGQPKINKVQGPATYENPLCAVKYSVLGGVPVQVALYIPCTCAL